MNNVTVHGSVSVCVRVAACTPKVDADDDDDDKPNEFASVDTLARIALHHIAYSSAMPL